MSVLSFLALFVLWTGSYFSLYMQSDCFAMVGAMLVSEGELPVRDFAGYTPPGSYYILAAVFRLFGQSVLAARFAFSTLPKWFTVVLIYRMSRRLGSPLWVALGSAAFAVLALGNGTFTGADYGGAHPTVLSTFLALAAVAAHVEFLFGGPVAWLALSGACTGLNALIRYDLALYALLAFCAAHEIARRRAAAGSRPRGAEPYLWYGLGALAIAGPAVVYFACKVPAADLRMSFIDYPRAYLQTAGVMSDGFALDRILGVFRTPSGAATLKEFLSAWWLYDAFRTLTFFGLGWSWVWLFGALKRSRALDGRELGIAALAFLGTFMIGYYVKSGNLYSLPVPFFILLPVLAYRRAPSRSLLARGVAGLTCASMIWLGYLMWYYKHVLPLPGNRALDIPSAQGVILSTDEIGVLEPLVGAVQALVPPGERIFICDRRWDVYNPTPEMLYFLTGRAPGTAYFNIQPGITDREDVQRRIVSDLIRNRVRYVIQSDWKEVKQPMAASGPILDGFIEEHFRETARFGPYRLLGPAPKGPRAKIL